MAENEITMGHGNDQESKSESNALNPKVHTKAQVNVASEGSQQKAKEADIPVQFIDTEFEVPTDDVSLPSGGLFYANGKDSVKIKYLTAEDENILTSSDLIKSGKVLDILLKNAIIDTDLTPEEMLTGDRNAVLMALRTTGYGDDYEVNTTCPSCSHENNSIVYLSELGRKEMADKPDSEGLFALQLPKCKANIKFRLLRGSDEVRLQKVAELGKKTIGKNIKVQTVLTERYLLQIMEVNGNRDKTYIKKFISVMPIADSLFFREYTKEIEPGVDLTYDFECKSCGHNYNTDVPITAKLFWPNAKI